MKIKLVGCVSTMNEVEFLLQGSELDCEFLDFSYHASPAKLHAKLQEVIDLSQDYEVIILVFGRCSSALLNLSSPRARLRFPNSHDCFGLLLGSNERYEQLQKENPAAYYFSQGWLDYGRTPLMEYHEYADRFGLAKARRLINTLYGRYQRTILLNSFDPNYGPKCHQKLAAIVNFFAWDVIEVKADLTLLTALLKGLPNQDIICLEPGQVVTEDIFGAR